MTVTVVEAPHLFTPLDQIGERLESFAPQLAAAGGLILLGVVAALLVRLAVIHLLLIWSNTVASRAASWARGTAADVQVRRVRRDDPAIGLFASFVSFLVFLVFLAAATETLELPVVSVWVLGLADYLPQVVAAVAVVTLGWLGGSFARRLVSGAGESARVAYAGALGQAVQFTIVAVSAVVAVDQLGIDVAFLLVTAAIVTAAVLGGGALAFGLGAQTAVRNIVATHYLSRTYSVGHRVRVGAIEGRILEITPTAVILDTPDGQAMVPAKEFSEQTSTLVGR